MVPSRCRIEGIGRAKEGNNLSKVVESRSTHHSLSKHFDCSRSIYYGINRFTMLSLELLQKVECLKREAGLTIPFPPPEPALASIPT